MAKTAITGEQRKNRLTLFLRRSKKMNLIILLCIPLVPAIIVTIYAVVTNTKDPKQSEPRTA
jgi:uncharacterized membrane protein YdjX (TVP38/TMEM64 family)